MTSSLNPSLHNLRSIPRGHARTWWLWPQPISPGFYGKEWSSTMWVTTNHLPSIASGSNQPGAVILALEAGGLHPFLAAAFDPGLVGDAISYEQFAFSMGVRSVVIDPRLGKRLSLVANENNVATSIRFGSHPHADRSQVIQRLAGAMILTLGQAIIFAMPLLLFGLSNLLAGFGILFSAALLLSLLWPLPRQKCLRCRFVLSILSTLLVITLTGLGFGFQLERLTWLAGAWWLSSFWLSFIFTGTKH